MTWARDPNHAMTWLLRACRGRDRASRPRHASVRCPPARGDAGGWASWPRCPRRACTAAVPRGCAKAERTRRAVERHREKDTATIDGAEYLGVSGWPRLVGLCSREIAAAARAPRSSLNAMPRSARRDALMRRRNRAARSTLTPWSPSPFPAAARLPRRAALPSMKFQACLFGPAQHDACGRPAAARGAGAPAVDAPRDVLHQAKNCGGRQQGPRAPGASHEGRAPRVVWWPSLETAAP